MAQDIRYETLTALAARQAIDAGTLTAAQLLEDCLARIEARESDVRAWTHVDAQGARARAAQLDRQPSCGLLHGLPFGIKDILDTHDMPSRYGSPIYVGHQPPWDAGCVALARHAGAVALGKTVTTEFANRHAGPTRNPHDLAHTPGGSSSGSAAAVADFHVPLALGTQTGGSVIRPAAYCGVYGYKPTYQIIGNAGVRTNTEAFDTVGLMARSIGDLALFRAALAAVPYQSVRPAPLRELTFAVCCTPWWDQASPESRDAIERSAGALAAGGARRVDLDLPPSFAQADPAHRLICAFEIVRNYSDELAHAREFISKDFLDQRVVPGERATLAEFRAALRLAETLRTEFAETLESRGIDFLLTPSAPGIAPEGLAFTGNVTFNFLWTLLHVPAVTLPRFAGPKGLPVGVQLIARRHQDQRLFDIAQSVDDYLISKDIA